MSAAADAGIDPGSADLSTPEPGRGAGRFPGPAMVVGRAGAAALADAGGIAVADARDATRLRPGGSAIARIDGQWVPGRRPEGRRCAVAATRSPGRRAA